MTARVLKSADEKQYSHDRDLEQQYVEILRLRAKVAEAERKVLRGGPAGLRVVVAQRPS